MPSTLVPVATVSNDGWAVVGAPTAHEALDEGVDSSDAAASMITATVSAAIATARFGLPAYGTPISLGPTDGLFRLYLSTFPSGSRAINVTIYAGAVILDRLEFTATPTWRSREQNFDLSAAGADWSDLQVELRTNGTFGDAVVRRISAFEVVLPDTANQNPLVRCLKPSILCVPTESSDGASSGDSSSGLAGGAVSRSVHPKTVNG